MAGRLPPSNEPNPPGSRASPQGRGGFRVDPDPAEKDKGWEFTDLSKFDLEAFNPADDGNVS